MAKIVARYLFVVLLISACLAGCDDDRHSPLHPDPGSELIEVPFSIGADEYLDNRFFFLDLPDLEASGRQTGESILISSVKVFRQLEDGVFGPNDIQNVAVYIDSTGFRDWQAIDFSQPRAYGRRWRQIRNLDVILDENGSLKVIDLGSSITAADVLAVVYNVVDEQHVVVVCVGDDPALVDRTQTLPGEGDELYFRMKMLKAPSDDNDPRLFRHVARNIYSLGARNIDVSSFELQIEVLSDVPHPELAEGDLPWIQLFGLDQTGVDGTAVPDGMADFYNPKIFDLVGGLLVFPFSMQRPFAAESAQYLRYVEPGQYPWEGSTLQQNLMPEIYDPAVPTADYAQYRRFRITGSRLQLDRSGGPELHVPLGQLGWLWASAPVCDQSVDYVTATFDTRRFDPADRVAHVRWFLPSERTRRRDLYPDLSGLEGDLTQPTLDLYLRTDDNPWHAENWGGISTGLSRSGVDCSAYQTVEIWVNDHQPEAALRTGRLHLDFGRVSEDGFWPVAGGELELGTLQWEDTNRDGVFVFDEDIGLDGLGLNGPQRFDAAYELAGDRPYPFINGTARNNREDSEDINGNTVLDLDQGYFTHTIDLRETEPVVDVVRDYEDVQDLVDAQISWRRYRLNVADFIPIDVSAQPDLSWVTHVRIWYEDESPAAPDEVHLQFSELKFVE